MSRVSVLNVGTALVVSAGLVILIQTFTSSSTYACLGIGLAMIGYHVSHTYSPHSLIDRLTPWTRKMMFEESIFDFLYNRDFITKYVRMWSRLFALCFNASLTDADAMELLNGMDDTFINSVFSAGLVSSLPKVVQPAEMRNRIPVDRKVALAIVRDRRMNPFVRDDMPQDLFVSLWRIVRPQLGIVTQACTAAVLLCMYLSPARPSNRAFVSTLGVGSLLGTWLMTSSVFDGIRARRSFSNLSSSGFVRTRPDFAHRHILLGGLHGAGIQILLKYYSARTSGMNGGALSRVSDATSSARSAPSETRTTTFVSDKSSSIQSLGSSGSSGILSNDSRTTPGSVARVSKLKVPFLEHVEGIPSEDADETETDSGRSRQGVMDLGFQGSRPLTAHPNVVSLIS